ncbi:Assimilatory nitrate reductase large subunit, partial [hydrothermal vent metagenome]
MAKKPLLTQISDLMMAVDGDLTQELALGQSDIGLGQLPKRLMPDQKASLICGYCSTGCSLDVHLKDGKAINLTPTKNYSVNNGEACPKGWEALVPLAAKDRATMPYLRNSRGHLEKVDWNTAMQMFVERFKGVQEKHGRESVAFLSTGQISTEEMALLGCLAKFGMGFLHGDGNTRQCMASAAVAYKQSFGFDAPPFAYEDLEESDCLVFVGANPCIAHPVIWQRVEANKNNPKIIVIDPRKTETAMRAHSHLAINPKTDLTLFYGIANILIENDWIDKKFIKNSVTGFEDFKNHVSGFTPNEVSRVTGLSVKQLEEFAQMIHDGKRVSFWWMVGLNQGHEAVRTIQALINLALITGNIGRPGTGANSITGQCNAMGSRLFSNTTGLIGGHDFTNEDHRRKIANILDIDITNIPDKNSMAYDQIVD